MYYKKIIKILLHTLHVLLLKTCLLYEKVSIGIYYGAKYVKQKINKNHNVNQSKIDNYCNFKKNLPVFPYDLLLVLFQLSSKFNLPVETINNILIQVDHVNLKKNICFLPFYGDCIRISRIYESNPPQYEYENNTIKLNNNLEARFYPAHPLRTKDKDLIIIFNKEEVIKKLTHNQALKPTTDKEDTIITEIFNAMHKEINHFNEYTKLSYTDLIFIDRAFNATNYEEIVRILQWLPTIKSKQLEKTIWLLLLEKAGHFWNTITINGQQYWEKENDKYVNHFLPKKQNTYALIETNCIPVQQHTLNLILKTQNVYASFSIYHQTPPFKARIKTIYNKELCPELCFFITFPHGNANDPLHIYNKYPFPFALITIEKN